MNPASLGDLPAVLAWAERRAPGARVAGCAVRPLAGGAVARRVDQVTLHLTGHHEPLELVYKQAPAHEIAGLRAAQAVRQETTAIPELVAWASAAAESAQARADVRFVSIQLVAALDRVCPRGFAPHVPGVPQHSRFPPPSALTTRPAPGLTATM